LLLDDDFHSTNTNHGMFQDLSLLAYSLMKYDKPKNSKEYKKSIKRLNLYFSNAFTSDGVHKEHSLDYHYMVTSNVKNVSTVISQLAEDNSKDEIKLRDIYLGAERYAMHILQPNLRVPKIGDCSGFNLLEKKMYIDLFNSEEFSYIKSSGLRGTQPKDKQVYFESSGYFISRSDWSENANYFLFIASYQAEYHKHTDDLSFLLYKNGDIFIDSGPNGYNYDSKYTKYAYSGFAHSNLVVNNQSLNRHDGNFEAVGIEHAEYDKNGDEFIVKGFNKRYENVEHYRTISGNHEFQQYRILDEI